MPSPCTPSLGSSNKGLGWVAEGSARPPAHDNLPAAPKPGVQRDALERLRAAGLWAGAGAPRPQCWGAVMEGEPPPQMCLWNRDSAWRLGWSSWEAAGGAQPPQTLLGAAAWSHMGNGVPHLGTVPARRHGNRHRERAAPCAPSQAVPPRESHGGARGDGAETSGRGKPWRCALVAVPSPLRSTGRCPQGAAGYSLRKMRLLLLAGMSTCKHRAGVRGGGHHHGDRPPQGLSTYHPLQAHPVGLSQLPQQRRVPKAPGGVAAGKGGTGEPGGWTGRHLTPKMTPSPRGAPRWGGSPEPLL